MKKIYIIRHAKSEWKDIYKNDFDRTLNKRGNKDILTMSKALQEQSVIPDLIISSSAKRAKLTAIGLTRHLNYKGKITFMNTLYMAEPFTIIADIQKIDDKYNTLFIIGHNPETTELVNMMMDDYINNVPTLGIVAFNLSIQHWKKFRPQRSKFEFFIYPKMFK